MSNPAGNTVQRWDEARARFADLDARIHAVITWIEESREDAVQLDKQAESGHAGGALHGLLTGIKDNIDTAGVRTTAGASFLRDNVPSEDATSVRRLRGHGAVIVAKLNMAELAWGATTQNLNYGACRNPWDTDRIPGGSSGGSGAAIAAGYCELALGTDTGASVRVPAALNGVVGLRPTVGSISNHGVFPVARTQDTVGPMARTAEAAARLTEALVGFDHLDPYSLHPSGPAASSRLGEPVGGLRVGVPESFFFDDLDPGVSTRIDDFLRFLREAGTELVTLPDFGQADGFEHWTRIVQCEGAAVHRDRLAKSPQDFSDDVRGRASAGLHVLATDLVRSLDWRAVYRRRLERIFENVDLIVTPVVPIDVPLAGGYDSRAQTEALGRITYPWALHAGPTLSLPIGFHPSSGMPVAVAVAGGSWQEATLFQLAHAYQQRTDWHLRFPTNTA